MKIDLIVSVIRESASDTPNTAADRNVVTVTLHNVTAEQIATVVEQTGDLNWQVSSSGEYCVWVSCAYATLFMRDKTIAELGNNEAVAFATYLVKTAQEAYRYAHEDD